MQCKLKTINLQATCHPLTNANKEYFNYKSVVINKTPLKSPTRLSQPCHSILDKKNPKGFEF